MDWLEVAGVIGLFILRLGVPLAITLAVGYWLRRLDAKWQAEALARKAEAALAAEEAGAEPAFELLKVIEQPCWVLHECPESAYLGCPAPQRPDLPCWLARLRVDGRLPQPCYQCELFTADKIKYRQPVAN